MNKGNKEECLKNEKWQKFKKEFWGKKLLANTEWGLIDFDPRGKDDMVGGDTLSYDEYLDLQMQSGKKVRTYFEICYYDADFFSFKRYCELRDSKDKAFHIYRGCSRCWMNKDDDEKKYGSSGINILWPITSNEDYKTELSNAKDGKSPNNISPIIKYSLNNGVTVLWFGDLENTFMEKIKDLIELPKADIIFAPHHGRSSGKIPKEWMESIDPKIVVIGEAPSEKINYLSGYNTITQNTAGNIIFDCDTGIVDVYVSNEKYSVDFLKDKKKSNKYNGKYIGSLDV